MGSLYLTDEEIAAIKAIDRSELSERVRQALDERSASVLSGLRLSSATAGIAQKLYRFERDLEKLAQAKSDAKRKQTFSTAWSSGDDLKHAVSMLKQMAEDQEAETQFVLIDDRIMPPHWFQSRVEVTVHFSWRATPDASWNSGTSTFFHDIDLSPDYTLPQPTRKLSAPKQAEKDQGTLADHWGTLRTQSLHAVREYLTTGGDGAKIPQRFEAKPGGRDRFLNNFSCSFWITLGEPRDRPRQKFYEPIRGTSTPQSPSAAATPDGALTLGSRVSHKKFGVGVVTHIEGDKVEAEFDESGSKRVLASFLVPVAGDEDGPDQRQEVPEE